MRHLNEHIIVILFLVLLLFSGCSSDDGYEKLKLQSSSSHYNYYYVQDDAITLDTVWMESHYNWVKDKLALEESPLLNYYKYKDKHHLTSSTGKNTNGFAEIGTLNFHSIWHPEGHENVHVLVHNEWGHPPALFTEGIAVALAPQAIYGFGNFNPEPTWNGNKLDEIALSFLEQEQIPDLHALLESNSFHTLDSNLSYPVAGSFVRYLMNEYQLENLKEVFKNTSFFDTSQKLITAFSQTYGKELSLCWDEWQQFLTNQ